MTAIEAIEAALRIRDLWAPRNPISKEHVEEALALTEMELNFRTVLADAAKKKCPDCGYDHCVNYGWDKWECPICHYLFRIKGTK